MTDSPYQNDPNSGNYGPPPNGGTDNLPQTQQPNSGYQTWDTNYNPNKMNKEQKYQDWESSTAYQRGIDDMKAAGINPLIAYSNAQESSPTTATQTATQKGTDIAGAATGGISTALSAILLGMLIL